MIEYALLVMLGFCAAGLLAMLIAPTIWNRAVRLTTKRLDATLPMSLSDIEADKDLLRASYAIQIRRLEAGLNKARDKSANQLVEISKLQMVIGEMRDRAGTMEKQLDERRNAANVFERTITKRFPEMEAAMDAAKAALEERGYEITDLANKLRRKEEALTLAQRSATLQQSEIRKLREAFEGGAADRTGRFKKRPTQWSLEEFRAEYDRLSLELSKMREMLALAQERETGQVAVLRGELQNLAQQIMTSVAANERQTVAQRQADTPPSAAPRDQAPTTRRSAPAERGLAAPQPWPSGGMRPAEKPAEPVVRPPTTPARAQILPPAASPSVARPEAPARREAESPPSRASEGRRPSIADEAASKGGPKSETSALKSLLDRAAAVSQKDNKADTAGSGAAMRQPVREQMPSSPVMEKPQGATFASARGEPAAAERQHPTSSQPGAAEPNIDRMLREIFDPRGTVTPAAEEPAGKAAPDVPAETATKPEPQSSAPASAVDGKPAGEQGEAADPEKSRSLADRLRVV